MVSFNHTLSDDGRLGPGIRLMLENRPAMHIGELRLRLGADRNALQRELERMRAAGEVVRLRPVNCEGDDHDFFRLPGPAADAVNWSAFQATLTERDIRRHVSLAGEAVACLTV
jgi:hypothetical protein